MRPRPPPSRALPAARSRSSGPAGDDFLHDRLHPCGRVDLEAGIDAGRRITAWRHRATSYHLSMFGSFDPNEVDTPDVSPWGGFDTPYAIQNLLVEYKDIESPIHTGAWRAVFYPPNVFARESFVDEIAASLGRDPLALRLELLGGDPVLTLPPWRIDRGRLKARSRARRPPVSVGCAASRPAGAALRPRHCVQRLPRRDRARARRGGLGGIRPATCACIGS